MRATRVELLQAACVFLFAGLLWAQDPVAKGVQEFREGNYEAAKTTLQQALEQKPGDAHARTFLALARAATGGCDAAASDLSATFAGTPIPDLRRLAGLALAQC